MSRAANSSLLPLRSSPAKAGAWALVVAGLAGAAGWSSSPTTGPDASEITWAFENGRWFDGAGFTEKTFYAVDGYFTDVEPANVDSTLDLSGLWIVPPFGEAHNHNVEDSRLEAVNRTYLENGIFYVKNPNSIPRFIEEARVFVERSETIDASFAQGGWTAPEGHPTGLYLRNLGRGIFREEDGEGAFFRTVESLADIEAKWDDYLGDDPDFMKVYLLYSEGPSSFRQPHWIGLDPPLVRDLVERAHADSLRVMAHVETVADFRAAVAAGVDEIAHLPGFRPGPGDRLAPSEVYRLTAADARQAAERGMIVVTTASFVGDFDGANPPAKIDSSSLDRWRSIVLGNLETLEAAGVTMAVGSDRYDSTSRTEAEWLAGLESLSNLDVLKMWSETTPARIFPDRRLGKLQAGYEASFLALGADPLADFAATQDIMVRFKQGHRIVLSDAAPSVD